LKRISEGVLNGSVLYAEIPAEGYTGGKTLVKDFMAPFRGIRASQAVQRFETRRASKPRWIGPKFRERMDQDPRLMCPDPGFPGTLPG
ncbi:MAG: hypothetical protein QJR00_08170, partial [Bacillota bacterium]|nr:hypothetical protein [Bacillota bacterium]